MFKIIKYYYYGIKKIIQAFKDIDKIKFKRYELSSKRLSELKKYVKENQSEEYEYIVLTIEQYQKHNNDYLNAYLNKIYYYYHNNKKNSKNN